MANLIKLRDHTIHHTDKIFVDTNVWFWFTYAASNEIETENQPLRYQTLNYPEFLEKILDTGASLFHSPLTLAELSNVIDRTEKEIHNVRNQKDLTRKEFRNNLACRERVINEIEIAWRAINDISSSIDVNLNHEFSDSALKIYSQCTLDPYDSFYVKMMRDYGINSILTDDKDFLSVQGINVLTYRN